MDIKKYLNKEELIKLIKFGITGGINTVVDFLVYNLLYYVCGVNIYLAQTAGYLIGMVNSFLINRKWTFHTKNKLLGAETVKFMLVNLFTMGVSYLLLYIFNSVMGLSAMVSKLLVLGATMFFNFILSRLWVFKNTEN